MLIILVVSTTAGCTAAAVSQLSPEISSEPAASVLFEPPSAFSETEAQQTEDSPDGTAKTSYKILEGTELENEIAVLKGPAEGAKVFVIGGMHGLEIAGWIAANRLKEQANLTAGTLYILSPANKWGAQTYSRYVTPQGGDLNRAFPGDPDGDAVERIAHAIYSEIMRIEPDIVLDLHEGSIMAGESKFASVGNSIIYHADVNSISDFLFEFLLENESGSLCSAPFTLLTPAVDGGLNQVATDALGIPVLTVETFNGPQSVVRTRIEDHLDILHFTLRYFGLEAS